jgi:hypothetical protein
MNRTLHLLIELALAAAVGCLSAYAFLYMLHAPATGRVSTSTIALVATVVLHAQDAPSVVIGADPGAHVPIDIMRNGKHATVNVELARLPAQQAAR